MRVAGPAVLLGVSLIALFVALAIGGGANPQLLEDPGPVVRYGLPITSLLVNLGAAGVLGALVLALFALRHDRPEFNRALDIAAGSAALLTVAAAATAFFTFLQVTNRAIRFDDSYGELLGQFLTQVALGQAWLTITLIAAAITVLCFAVRNVTALVFVGLLAVAMLWPMAEQGHAAGATSHDAAVTALMLHLVFAAVWLGGLVVVALLARQLDSESFVNVVSRYSSVALVCFVVVAASGYVSAALRVGTLDNLLSPYGLLIGLKVAALLSLGVFGAIYRRTLIGKLADSGRRRHFVTLVVVELGFMGIATGVAAALAKSAPPVSEVILGVQTPAQILTGELLPPELTAMSYVSTWNFDLLWSLLIGFGIFFYVAGVVRLRRRGNQQQRHHHAERHVPEHVHAEQVLLVHVDGAVGDVEQHQHAGDPE
jgi:putative copper export protein